MYFSKLKLGLRESYLKEITKAIEKSKKMPGKKSVLRLMVIEAARKEWKETQSFPTKNAKNNTFATIDKLI
jgi:hypothetical protein